MGAPYRAQDLDACVYKQFSKLRKENKGEEMKNKGVKMLLRAMKYNTGH